MHVTDKPATPGEPANESRTVAAFAVELDDIVRRFGTVDGEIVGFNCIVPAFMVKKGQLEDDLGPRLVAMVRNIEASLGLH